MLTENEDEIAMIIGHEISHIILGHVEFALQRFELVSKPNGKASQEYKDFQINFVKSQHETEADRWGFILALNAEYNPYASVTLAPKILTSQCPIWLICPAIEWIIVDEHGTAAQRKDRYAELIKLFAIRPNDKIERSKLFLEAKAEYLNQNR